MIPPPPLAAAAALGAMLFGSLLSAFAQDPASPTGTYRRQPVENGWHVGTIGAVGVAGVGGTTRFRWKNEAGVEWGLTSSRPGILETDTSNPYRESGAREFVLRTRGGEVIGFEFNGDFFVKDGVDLLTQQSAGFHGYISAQVEPPPAGYGYGASFYVSIWPLVSENLANFQIGLPSTWIIPDNRDFDQPLCPPGTVARDQWPERGPYYREVFQTIEGGLGYWASTRFKSVTPKYRMNGTPNGYNHEISSPGWGFGKTTALRPEEMGIAQLSNRLVVPPDGITFEKHANGKLLGNAWMALPITRATGGPEVPTGHQAWTLYLNSVNFKGPVAFFIPQTWSRLSRDYRTIVGRGLDARPGLMGSGAMEVNTVPFFSADDSRGKRYTRIPRIQFPVNERGETRLMQDITFYGETALLRSGAFDPEKAWKPELRALPLSFSQGAEKTPLKGFGNSVETAIFGEPGARCFGLRWRGAAPGFAALPEYFEEVGRERVAVSADRVPAETKLREQEFRQTGGGAAYTSPNSGAWTIPGPASPRIRTVLSDGSVLVYAWYRFVDQPSFQSFQWSAEEKARIQDTVERMHARWPIDRDYLPPPSSGELVALDRAVVVTPPEGLEIGFVPIALSQTSASTR